MREIEIKLRVEDLSLLGKKLKDFGCSFSESVEQHDTIYSEIKNVKEFTDSYEGHIAIRIRHEENRIKLTLKQQRSNEMDNIECETEIKDANAIHEMLTILGWKPEVEVKKNRKKGKLGEYKICLDRVDKLGEYMELEKMTNNDANPDEVRKELFKAIKPFGLSEKDEETKGYDTLIYNLRNN